MPQGRLAFSSLALSSLLAAALAAPPANAQQPKPGQLAPGASQPAPRAQGGQLPQLAPPKPYKEVAVTPPQPSTDPSFAAFRKQLGDIANRKDRAALARLVVPTNFFWLGEKGDKANKRRSSIDNLAAAIDLDAKDDSGWSIIADAADETSLEPLPQRRGVVCSPAGAMFDEKAAEQLAKDTGTDLGDWAYPAKAGVDVRSAAQPNAPVIDKLGLNLVRVIPDPPPAAGQPPQLPFLRAVTPAGKVGFVEEESLARLFFDQLCYIKDATGWKIAGYAGE